MSAAAAPAIAHLAQRVDGLAWELTVVPRPQLRPIYALRVRGTAGTGESWRKVDHTRELDDAQLEVAVDELCRALNVRRLAGEAVRMEKLDLSKVSLAEVAAAMRAQLDVYESQLAELEEIQDKRDRLACALAALAAADGPTAGAQGSKSRKGVRAPGQRNGAAGAPPATKAPGVRPVELRAGSILARIVAAMGQDPARDRDAKAVAAAVPGVGLASVSATLSQLAKVGRVRRVGLGKYRVAA